MHRYTLSELESLPTISQGWTANLKVQTGTVRVWLERTTVADGMPYDNMVTVEELQSDGWHTTDEYPAGD